MESLISDVVKMVYSILTLPGLITLKIIDSRHRLIEHDGELKFVYQASFSICSYFVVLLGSVTKHHYGIVSVLGYFIDVQNAGFVNSLYASSKSGQVGLGISDVYITITITILMFLVGTIVYSAFIGYIVGQLNRPVRRYLLTESREKHLVTAIIYVLLSVTSTIWAIPWIIG